MGGKKRKSSTTPRIVRLAKTMTAHEILHEKKVGNGADFKVRCQNANTYTPLCFDHHRQPTSPSSSPMDPSPRVVLVVDADEEFVVGDVFEEERCSGEFTKLSCETGNIHRVMLPRTSPASPLSAPTWFVSS